MYFPLICERTKRDLSAPEEVFCANSVCNSLWPDILDQSKLRGKNRHLLFSVMTDDLVTGYLIS